MTASNCKRCQKEGLPLFISRFSVGRGSAIRSPIATPAGYPELPASSCYYTLRNLRSGYLYIYDSLDNSIKAYSLTSGGLATLINASEAQATTEAFKEQHTACMQQGQKFANAALITVPRPTVARSIFISYSEYKWTQAVLNAHKGASAAAVEKRRHMTEVKIGGNTASSLPIQRLQNSVNEYSLTNAQGQQSFAWSTRGFLELKGSTPKIINEANRLAPGKGLVIAINDPVALMSDISALLDELGRIWQQAHRHPLTVYGEIESLKTAVQMDAANNAALNFDQARSAITEETTEQIFVPALGSYIDTPTIAVTGYRNKEDLPPLTPQQLQQLRNRISASQQSAWARYQREFSSPTAPDNWKKDFDAKAVDYQKRFIEPLAKAHLAWFKSNTLFYYMRANFDSSLIQSGMEYSTTVMALVGNTQMLPENFTYYCQLLKGDIKHAANYLCRGLLFNQQAALNQVQSKLADFDFMSGSTKHAWSGLIFGVTQSIDLAIVGRATILEGFVKAISAPVSQVIKEAVDGASAAYKVPLLLGAHYQRPVVRVEVNGTKLEYTKFITQEILKASGKKINSDDLKRAVKLQLLQLEAAGVVDLKSRNRSAFALVVDINELNNVNYNTPNSQRAPAMASSIRSAQDVSELRFKDYSKAVSTNKKMSFGAGLFAATLQGIAIFSMYQDMMKATPTQLLETSTKFVAGIVAGVASVLDVMERRFEAVMKTALDDATKVKSGLKMNICKFLKIPGLIAAAVVFAAWDIKSGIDARGKGNETLSTLYFSSAALGLASTVAFLIGGALMTGVGIVLVIAMIAVAFAINYFSSNALQDWIRQGYFGKRKANWTLSTELKKQQEALAALASS
ncbi:T6SS effector BTH_I2691 family protein [Acinetobacter dispersus]|uniref:T6SS effector BTH_I2691 family protein n=1 Tax=Acinetobacter dispersus TaxID=70348 RepID=UPI001F4B4836|nr:T6SS effector BTH_I2691 family protein [Acinetobacter dispersus]MCH7390269.1 hypothetical protein [Acinetobacter dispersus]